MPNHKDAEKRMRQSEDARVRNKHNRSRMRNQIKALRAAIDSGDAETATAQLPKTVSVIQRTAKKGVIHRRQAARRVSRLTAQVNALSQPSEG